MTQKSFEGEIIRDESGTATGMYFPDEAVKGLKGRVTMDGVEYPYVLSNSKGDGRKRKDEATTPLVQLPDGRWASWESTPAMEQHAKNVLALTPIPADQPVQ
jgi:hypothetical protein